MVDVDELRRLCTQKLTLQQIADQFGVSRQRIHQIVRKNTIAWTPTPIARRESVPPCPIAGARYIPLGNDQFAIVDESDYELVATYTWHRSDKGYAVGRNSTQMHRLIMDAPTNMEIDHIDGNPLNNQRYNLRLCNRSENNWNRRRNGHSKSPYKGVVFHKKTGKWTARICANGQTTSLRYFDTPEEAAEAYNKAAIRIHGKFARLNTIEQ